MNLLADRLVTRVAAQALCDYDLSGQAFRQEVEALAQQITEAIEAHLESLGLEKRT